MAQKIFFLIFLSHISATVVSKITFGENRYIFGLFNMSPKRMSFVEDIAYSSLKDDSFKNISELKFNEQ